MDSFLASQFKEFDCPSNRQHLNLTSLKAQLDPGHPKILTLMNNLANAYQGVGKFDKALPFLEETLATQEATLGPDHPDTLTSMYNLASAYYAAGKLDKALPLFEETVARQSPTLGPVHPYTLRSKNNLAIAYRDRGRLGEARPLFVEAVIGARQTLGLAHPHTQSYMRNLADCYAKLRQPENAEPLWTELADFWLTKAGPDSPQYAQELALHGLSLLEQQAFTDAEPLLRECIGVREKTEPDAWTTFNTQSMLGGSLLGQKKYAEAERLLLVGYEGLKEREAKIPPLGKIRITEALERLVDLYEAWDKPDEAARWRKKLNELRTNQHESKESPKN